MKEKNITTIADLQRNKNNLVITKRGNKRKWQNLLQDEMMLEDETNVKRK